MIDIEVKIVPNKIKRELNDFQKMVYILFDTYENKMKDTHDYRSLKKQLLPYKNYSWFKIVADAIDKQNQILIQNTQFKRVRNKITLQQIKQVNSKAVAAFRSGNIDTIVNKIGPMLKKYMPAFERQSQQDFDFNNVVYNPVKKNAPWGAGIDTQLISSFTKAAADEIVAIDLHKKWFTYIDYPTGTTDIYDVIYYMQNLQQSTEPVELNGKTALKYMMMSSSKEDAIQFNTDMTKYLRNNNTESLQRIIAMVNSLPLLRQLNEVAKDGVTGTSLYRGVGIRNEDGISVYDDEVIKQELMKDGVAVSRSYSAAENFAHQRGHLDGNISRVDNAYLIEYVPSKDDILIVMDIFGSVYGESEIIIKPTKDNLKQIVDLNDE